MSRMPRYLKVCSVCLVVLGCVTGAFLITRASVENSVPVPQIAAPPSMGRGSRNLSRQPEALRVSRRLGKRFDPSSRVASVLTGKVTIAGSEQPLTIIRRQSEKGEDVELRIAGRVVSRGMGESARAGSSGLTETEQSLVERLVYDSSDYFVLAQLRGASYYTVARHVRPDYAPDNYDGPLWTVVRVEEPRVVDEQNEESVREWRLFYINSVTGLIDKIAGEEKGQPIEANFSDWTEQSGEKFPTTITWTSNGQTLMTFNLTNLSTAAH